MTASIRPGEPCRGLLNEQRGLQGTNVSARRNSNSDSSVARVCTALPTDNFPTQTTSQTRQPHVSVGQGHNHSNGQGWAFGHSFRSRTEKTPTSTTNVFFVDSNSQTSHEDSPPPRNHNITPLAAIGTLAIITGLFFTILGGVTLTPPMLITGIALLALGIIAVSIAGSSRHHRQEGVPGNS